VDDWRFEPTDMTVLAEQEAAALSILAESDLVAATIALAEAEEEMEEFHAWLDSLEPTIEELEYRDAFLGHGA
jgi:hypothetical protein